MGEIRQVWRGYDRAKVEVQLNVLDVENERLRSRLSDAKEELEFLREARTLTIEEGDEITRALVLAERTANAVRDDARLDAEIIRRQAEAELESVSGDIALAKRRLGELHGMAVSLREGETSAVSARIALLIDGDDGVGPDSAAAQRMLEFAELLHLGPRGEPAPTEPVPRRVEVPARVATPRAASTKPIPARQTGGVSNSAADRPSTDTVIASAPPSPPPARELHPLVASAAAPDAPDSGVVPAPARHKALAQTAETIGKQPLAARRKRVIRKSIEEKAEV